MKIKENRKGQVSIFVIVALIIALAILLFFAFREKVIGENIPPELTPVFDYYRECIEQETRAGIELAETQGGRINVENYFPGSEYAPFSSHLNFLGFPVPYWFYISGNGLIKEQVPVKSEIEAEIENFVEQGLKECDIEIFNSQGFLVEAGEPTVNVDVQDTKVEVVVSSDLSVSKGELFWRKTSHNVEVESKLGKFFDIARDIYTKQKAESFFEKYAVDILYSYAPVDGVEIQCGPKVWATQNVMQELKTGLQENFATIKFKGNYYSLKDKKRKYFVVDKTVDESVKIMYSKDWPTKIEIIGYGVDENIMMAEAVGTQEGMGMMGFCYVPYHFVYDFSFPVLIQIFDEEELFQFPVVIVIDNNVPRKANLAGTPYELEEEFDVCAFETQDVEINIFDVNLNRVDANVSYECFNQKCRIGETKDGQFVGKIPACVNGYLHLSAGGYTEHKQLFSSNKESYVDIVLEREQDIKVDVVAGGKKLDGTAIVSFVKEDGRAKSVALPDFDEVKLSEGSYEIRVYVYGNSSVVIPASSKTECVDVPRGGMLGGLFGLTKEECFEIKLERTEIEHSLVGGGKLETYLLGSELEKGGLTLEVDKFPTPDSIEELSKNFELFETKYVGMRFYNA